MAQSLCNLLYHIIFGTKGHRPQLGGHVRDRLHDYLGGALRGQGGVVLEINGTEDHVHICAKLRQDKAVSDVIRASKANTSGWVHRTFPELAEFAWQSGYGAFTVSESQVDKLRQYIRGQQRHHEKQSFKEELIALLKAHGIAFHERDIFG